MPDTTTETRTPAEELRTAALALTEGDEALTREVNEPLAAWLETEAHMIERHGLSPEGHSFDALRVARAINGKAA